MPHGRGRIAATTLKCLLRLSKIDLRSFGITWALGSFNCGAAGQVHGPINMFMGGQRGTPDTEARLTEKKAVQSKRNADITFYFVSESLKIKGIIQSSYIRQFRVGPVSLLLLGWLFFSEAQQSSAFGGPVSLDSLDEDYPFPHPTGAMHKEIYSR